MGLGSSLSLQTSDFDEVLTSSNRSGDVFQWRAKKTLQKTALQYSESISGHGGWLGHNLNESKVDDVRCVEFGCGRPLAPREQRLQEAGPRLGLRPDPVELQGLPLLLQQGGDRVLQH